MKPALCVLVIIVLPILTNADTLTLSNNSSLNGSVLYADDIFYVEASYASGVEHYKIPRRTVIRDEINYETYNQGSPPPGVTGYKVGPSIWTAMKNARQEPTPAFTRSRNSPAAYPKHPVIALRNPRLEETSQAGDVVKLTDGDEEVGTLTAITAQAVHLKKPGKKHDKIYERRKVLLITVGR